jgi:hypothetical protein
VCIEIERQIYRRCLLVDAIYMMDGESRLKVCECVLLCVYKCTRACEQHFLLTRNCATLFIRRREIWKLLPAHLRALRVLLATSGGGGGGVGLSLVRSQNMRRQQQSEKVQAAPLGLVRGRRQVAETQRFIKPTHLIIITSILCPSPLGGLYKTHFSFLHLIVSQPAWVPNS